MTMSMTPTYQHPPHTPDAAPQSMISLRGLGKTYPDGTVAVGSIDLDVPEGQLVCLVGPSGCGKTTTLKMINRLIEPSCGKIFIDGNEVTGVSPLHLRRGIGYVIQQVGLFPHENIWNNVATVPRLLGWNKQRCRQRAGELLELVGLDPAAYGNRYPAQLSGGQRQRVGVARALAADPPVLLMDEPFSAIDPIARHNLQQEFLRVQREVRKTIVMVTHDIDEAVLLSDKIAIFKQGGSLEQYDSPAALLSRPANDFVAEFVGAERGLRRLGVTPIQTDDIGRQPTVHTDDRLAPARHTLDDQRARWAVVLEPDQRLAGWIKRADMDGDGLVRERIRPLDATVGADSTLKDAMAEMLQHDAGWVAVIEPGTRRYLGVLTPTLLHTALRRAVDLENTVEITPSVEVLDTMMKA